MGKTVKKFMEGNDAMVAGAIAAGVTDTVTMSLGSMPAAFG